MTFTSKGFDGTVDEVAWAAMMPNQGTRFSVQTEGALVTIGGTGDRAITVAPFTATGDGVRTVNSAAVNLTASAPSGTSTRWDTVVITRHWAGAGGTATVALREGTSSKALSTAVLDDPGVDSDQPIALIRLLGGNTAVQEVVPLQGWTAGLTYHGAQMIPDPVGVAKGQSVLIDYPANSGSLDLLVQGEDAGSEEWRSLLAPSWQSPALASGISAVSGLTPRITLAGGKVHLEGRVVRSSTAMFAVGVDYTIFSSVLASALRPDRQIVDTQAVVWDGTAQSARITVSTAGVVVVNVAGTTSSVFLKLSWFPKP